MAERVQDVLQVAILRGLERGLQVDEVTLAREVPGADPRDVSRAIELLRETGHVELTSGGWQHLALTALGRQRLEEGRG